MGGVFAESDMDSLVQLAQAHGVSLKVLSAARDVNHFLAERLELASRLYREYHTRCFWHCPHDLAITEDLIPFVVKGLRTYGGHRGSILASKLLPEENPRYE